MFLIQVARLTTEFIVRDKEDRFRDVQEKASPSDTVATS
jgi:hypothetical protein